MLFFIIYDILLSFGLHGRKNSVSTVDEVAEFIGKNLPCEFKDTLESHLQWGADTSWRDIMEPKGIGSAPSCPEAIRHELTILRRNRRLQGNKALIGAAEDLGTPKSYIHVGGGHYAAFAQFGSIILAVEPSDFIGQLPPKSEHRIGLAANHGHFLQQLEFRFGNEPVNRLDPRGATFVIIQHGVKLSSLEKSDCMLSHMALIVPKWDLEGLVISANIMGDGFRDRFVDPFDEAIGKISVVKDTVNPVVRARRRKRNGGENG